MPLVIVNVVYVLLDFSINLFPKASITVTPSGVT